MNACCSYKSKGRLCTLQEIPTAAKHSRTQSLLWFHCRMVLLELWAPLTFSSVLHIASPLFHLEICFIFLTFFLCIRFHYLRNWEICVKDYFLPYLTVTKLSVLRWLQPFESIELSWEISKYLEIRRKTRMHMQWTWNTLFQPFHPCDASLQTSRLRKFWEFHGNKEMLRSEG